MALSIRRGGVGGGVGAEGEIAEAKPISWNDRDR